MSKITVSTVKQTADVQVLYVNAYLISKVLRAQLALEDLVNQAKTEKRKWNEETKKWETVADENGNPVIEYTQIDGNVCNETVLPILTELVKAFEE